MDTVLGRRVDIAVEFVFQRSKDFIAVDFESVKFQLKSNLLL